MRRAVQRLRGAFFASTIVTMTTLLIVYETKYGQTRKIADYVADVAQKRGHAVVLRSMSEVNVRRLGDADAFMVLSPVFFGRHPPATRSFLAKHGDTLNARPSAFIAVSGSAGSERDEDRLAAHDQAVKFIATTPWRPNLVRTAGGAVDYAAYDFLTRFVMRMISKRQGRSLDMTRRHELTSWPAVTRITRELCAFIEPKRAVPAQAATQPSA